MNLFEKIKNFAVTVTGNAADITLELPEVAYVGESFQVKVNVAVEDVGYQVDDIKLTIHGRQSIAFPGDDIDVSYTKSFAPSLDENTSTTSKSTYGQHLRMTREEFEEYRAVDRRYMKFTVSKSVFFRQVSVVKDIELEPNKSSQWDMNVDLPADIPEPFTLPEFTQTFTVSASIEGFGANPKSPSYNLNVRHRNPA